MLIICHATTLADDFGYIMSTDYNMVTPYRVVDSLETAARWMNSRGEGNGKFEWYEEGYYGANIYKWVSNNPEGDKDENTIVVIEVTTLTPNDFKD